MAEYYRIYDYRQHKPIYIATLVIGLRADSRIKTELSGLKVPLSLLLQATSADRLGLLMWAQTKDAEKGINRPKSIASLLLGDKPEQKTKVYRTAEEFKAAWAEIAGG